MINFKSESANKTQQNNAKILFGKSGLTVIKKLEEYNKEKLVNTKGISALLEVLKTKDTELLAKFAASKTGKALVTNCKQLAGAKTFSAVIKNIKAIKVLKSFDKFSTPTSSGTDQRDATPPYIVKDFKGYSKEDYSSRLTPAQEKAIIDISIDLGEIYVKNERTAGKIVWDSVKEAGLDPVYVAKYLTESDPIQGQIDLMEDEILIIFNCITPKYRKALETAFRSNLSKQSKPKINSLQDIYGNLDASQDYEDITKDFNRLVGSNAQVVEMAADGGDNEALSVSIKGGTAYFLPAGQATTIAKELGISGKKDAIYVDSYKNHGPFNGTPDPIPGTLMESKNPAQKKAMLEQFTSWVKNGVPKSAVTSSFDVTNPSTYASLLDQQADTSVAQYRKTQKQIVNHIRKLGRIPNSWDINLEEDAADVDGYFLEINPKSKKYSGDMHVICLGGVSSQDPGTKKWAPKGNTVAVIEQIDGEEYGEVRRMDLAKAIKYVVAKNK